MAHAILMFRRETVSRPAIDEIRHILFGFNLKPHIISCEPSNNMYVVALVGSYSELLRFGSNSAGICKFGISDDDGSFAPDPDKHQRIH